MRPGDEVLQARTRFNPQLVLRRGNLVVRDATPWTPAVHALLRYLEQEGIEAPRVAGSGFDEQGMETLIYVEGEVDPLAMWPMEGSYALGQMLKAVQEATSSFLPDANYTWFPSRLRRLGSPSLIGHCDLGPWNMVRRAGMPAAFIDWTRAGPVDPIIELAQVCWLNAHLHDDVVAEAEGLPSLEVRAAHLRAIADGYGLARADRETLVERMVEVAVSSAADDADQANVRKGTTGAEVPKELVWALTWQIRGAAWQIENRRTLLNALL
jgi:hypothetical protein